jgi:hypothetical protein
MKTATVKTNLSILVALFITAIAAAASAEERKPASTTGDNAKPKTGAARPLVEGNRPPYDDDDAYDRDDACHHHCFGWFHKKVHTPDPDAHKHDGFFMRFTAGPGFGSWQGTGVATVPAGLNPVTNPTGDGAKFGGSFSIGGAVNENLILHGDFWFNGNSPRQTRTTFQELGTGVAGGGATYYFMPQNVFVSGGVGLATSWLVILDPDNVDRDWEKDRRHDRIPDGFNYGTGVGAYLMVGKEWWVSDNWGLGAALQGDFARTQGRDLDINCSGVKVVFTATYN